MPTRLNFRQKKADTVANSIISDERRETAITEGIKDVRFFV